MKYQILQIVNKHREFFGNIKISRRDIWLFARKWDGFIPVDLYGIDQHAVGWVTKVWTNFWCTRLFAEIEWVKYDLYMQKKWYLSIAFRLKDHFIERIDLTKSPGDLFPHMPPIHFNCRSKVGEILNEK